MKLKNLTFIAAAMLFSFGCIEQGGTQSAAVQDKINQGALVVDVRTPQEFAVTHYPGAVNIPLQDINARINEFGDRNRPIVVYCRSGNRSSQAKAILEDHGFTDVINGGGLKDMLH